MLRSSLTMLCSTAVFVGAAAVIAIACDDALPPAMPVPVTTVSGPASSASDSPSSKPVESSSSSSSPEKENKLTCGDLTCKKGQQCCTVGPLRKPTCFTGAVCPH